LWPNSGNTVSLYLNGVLDRTVVVSAGITYSSCDTLFFNGTSTGGGCDEQDIVAAESSFHSGALDDVRVFDRAINASDVLSLYQEGGFAP